MQMKKGNDRNRFDPMINPGYRNYPPIRKRNYMSTLRSTSRKIYFYFIGPMSGLFIFAGIIYGLFRLNKRYYKYITADADPFIPANGWDRLGYYFYMMLVFLVAAILVISFIFINKNNIGFFLQPQF